MLKKQFDKLKKILVSHFVDGSDSLRIFIVLNILIFIGIVFLLLMAVLAYFQNNYPVAITNTIFSMLLISFQYLLIKYKKYALISEIGLILMLVHMVFLFINGSVDGTGYVWIYTYPLAAIFLLGVRKGIIYSAILITSVTTSFIFSSYIPHHYPYNPNLLLRVVPSYLVVMLFTFAWEKARLINEKKLIEARKIAENANNAKTEFINHISHELRTPLNAILGFSELLNKNVDDKKLLSYVDAIQLSGKSLLKIINNILDLAKIGAEKMEVEYHTFYLDEFFMEIEKVFHYQVSDKDIKFDILLDEKINFPIVTDETKLRQILVNLISNAFKFTSMGSISLEAKLIRKYNNNADIEFSVNDTGIGIPEDQQKSIFDAFSQRRGQSTKQYGGTGLGLTITQKFVELLGGDISLESDEKTGSKFRILFENMTIGDAQQKSIGENSKEYNFYNASVLIFSNDSISMTLLETTLIEYNLNIHNLSSLADIEDNIKKFKPQMIILELVQQQFHILNELEQIDRSTPLILINSVVKANVPQADEVLSKPYETNDLLHLIAKYLTHKQKTIQTISIKPLISSENLRLLNEKFYSDYLAIKSTMIIDDIIRFSGKIIEFGHETDNSEIIKYGELLFEHADKFSIDEMVRLLNLLDEKHEI